MKPFSLDPSMRATIGGAFYPTGYSMVMFPKPEDATRVGQQLIDGGVSRDDIFLLPPQAVLSQISPTVEQADDPLPSAGTEGATVRAYTKLAREGHAALLVKTDDSDAAERLMVAVRTVPYAIAQRYRALVIEDL
ncbi:hypothetical protein QTI51_12005 [Variovorax sp. J22G73]|jgi:hypothetical protein|uniref:hypothetical protein n=1 Tax=unclassified Variovorax TaxID=663243 RepID=UPI000D5EBD43|nr:MULTISPECIES: hypothetical protein [unclassified Variovorax]MDM0005974.1 hypothetical protein [Variovorax sp. J22R203]MDM0098002.1 hypothetical protein [Variovorax sp. J22G73]